MYEYEIHTVQQGTRKFTGTILGKATSEAAYHNHSADYVAPGRDPEGRKNKCGACRWFEVTIYRTQSSEFVLHTIGRTIIPGEIDYGRHVSTTSAFELVELATVRASVPYLPAPTARALAQAADLDEAIAEAYMNRAVI